MLIDWFTVGAQALNFLILVWLLKRFLYKPILNAIDSREKLIAGKLADADAKEQEAQKERDAYRQKNETFDKQRADLMIKVKDDAAAERHRRLDEAATAADALSAKRQATLRSDAESLNEALRRRTQQEVFAISRRTLTDLAGVSLEDRMADVFIQRLRTIGGRAKDTFASALKTANGPAVVRSAFDLPETQRAAIRTSLDETFAIRIEIRFETAPEVVSGVELTANGQKLAWSIADYLAAMEKGVQDLLDTPGAPQGEPTPDPAEKPSPAAPATGEVAPSTTVKSEPPKPETGRG